MQAPTALITDLLTGVERALKKLAVHQEKTTKIKLKVGRKETKPAAPKIVLKLRPAEASFVEESDPKYPEEDNDYHLSDELSDEEISREDLEIDSNDEEYHEQESFERVRASSSRKGNRKKARVKQPSGSQSSSDDDLGTTSSNKRRSAFETTSRPSKKQSTVKQRLLERVIKVKRQ